MKLGEKEREDTYRNRVFHGFLLIADELALKLNDLQDESISLKKKHTANTKDLTNQLQKLHKQLENQSKVKQSTETAAAASVRNASRTNSMCSLDKEGSISSGDSNNHNSTIVNNTLISNQHADVYVVDVDKQKIIEKVVKLQNMLAKKTEKIDFLQDHVNQLTNDLKKKSK